MAFFRVRQSGQRPSGPALQERFSSSVAAVQSCFCFINVAAAIVLGIGALFLLFVLLYSQRVASQSCETLGELLHHPTFPASAALLGAGVRHLQTADYI